MLSGTSKGFYQHECIMRAPPNYSRHMGQGLAGWFQQLGSAGRCHNYTMLAKGMCFLTDKKKIESNCITLNLIIMYYIYLYAKIFTFCYSNCFK